MTTAMPTTVKEAAPASGREAPVKGKKRKHPNASRAQQEVRHSFDMLCAACCLLVLGTILQQTCSSRPVCVFEQTTLRTDATVDELEARVISTN